MIDEVGITITSGKGGNGCISGRREKFVPHGGPDGGDGGSGGSVYLLANRNMGTLLTFRNRSVFAAKDGKAGAGGKRHGQAGEDLVIRVPVGTQVRLTGSPRNLLGDMSIDGQRLLVAHGGRGGRGNAGFASPTNRFPLLAQAGEPAEKASLKLELKILADVGIIGAPNAGKSSLLAAATRARPKIADYPFTTLEPVIGMCEHKGNSFVMVDIPGLIEGAHAGAGLGHEFLRHAERARVLLHVVDGSLEDGYGQWRTINQELERFEGPLAAKPQLVAINKMDVAEAQMRAPSLRRRLEEEGATVVEVSAVTGDGMPNVLDEVIAAIGELDEDRPAPVPEDLPVVRPAMREHPKVSRVNGTYVVDMSAAARIAEMIDQSNWQARNQFMRQLRRMGVVRALEREGIGPGDKVRVGKLEWEWS